MSESSGLSIYLGSIIGLADEPDKEVAEVNWLMSMLFSESAHDESSVRRSYRREIIEAAEVASQSL